VLNEVLLSEGYAQVSTYPPDVKYVQRFLADQVAACDAGLGPWARTAARRPRFPRARLPQSRQPPQPASASGQCAEVCPSPPPGCVIKGNISTSSNEKIYHLPGQQNYDELIIDPSDGERWFCIEQEAVADGWRAAKRSGTSLALGTMLRDEPADVVQV
jgi:hypothetical protein